MLYNEVMKVKVDILQEAKNFVCTGIWTHHLVTQTFFIIATTSL